MQGEVDGGLFGSYRGSGNSGYPEGPYGNFLGPIGAVHEGTPTGSQSNTFGLLGALGSRSGHELATGPEIWAKLNTTLGTIGVSDGHNPVAAHPDQLGYDRGSTSSTTEVPGAGNSTPEATPAQLQGAISPGGAIARQQSGVAIAGPPSPDQRFVPVAGTQSNRMVDEDGSRLGVDTPVPGWIANAPKLEHPWNVGADPSWDRFATRIGGVGKVGGAVLLGAGAIVAAKFGVLPVALGFGALAVDTGFQGLNEIYSGEAGGPSQIQAQIQDPLAPITHLASGGLQSLGLTEAESEPIAAFAVMAGLVALGARGSKKSATNGTVETTTRASTADGLRGVGDPRFATSVETAAAEAGQVVGVRSAEVGVHAPRVPATQELANEIASVGLPRSKQTVVLIETAEGRTIAAAGGPDLTVAQKALAQQRGLLVADDLPGFHGELTGMVTVGERGLLPTRGVTTNKMCRDGSYNCFDQIAEMARRGGYELRLSPDGRSFEFIKTGGN